MAGARAFTYPFKTPYVGCMRIVMAENRKMIFQHTHTGDHVALARVIDASLMPDIVNVTDEDGDTPLHVAILLKHRACAEVLIAKGSALNAANAGGATPLHLAAHAGSLSIVSALVENHADCNVTDKDDNTPLILASRQGHLGCVQALVLGGADVLARNKASFTAFHKAASHGYSDCLLALIKANGSGVDIVTGRDWAPLHYAVDMGHAKCLEILLDYGAKIEAANYKGATALHIASETGNVDCVEILLERHANAEAKTHNNETPLAVAAMSMVVTAKERRVTCAILLAHGAPLFPPFCCHALGATIPPGVRFSVRTLTNAKKLVCAIQTSISPDSVSEARVRILSAVSGVVGKDPHALFKATRSDDVMRPIMAAAVSEATAAAAAVAMASSPRGVSAAAASSDNPAEVPKPSCFTRDGLMSARAKLLTECASNAESDAAQRCIALLCSMDLGRDLSQPEKRNRLHPVGQPRTKAEEKAVYSAAVCVGRWGEISSARAAAEVAEGKAQTVLDTTRREMVSSLGKIEAEIAKGAFVAGDIEAVVPQFQGEGYEGYSSDEGDDEYSSDSDLSVDAE